MTSLCRVILSHSTPGLGHSPETQQAYCFRLVLVPVGHPAPWLASLCSLDKMEPVARPEWGYRCFLLRASGQAWVGPRHGKFRKESSRARQTDRGSPEACTLLTLPNACREPLAASECSLEIGPTPSVQDSSEWVLAGTRAQAAGCSEAVAVQAAQGFPGDRGGF